MWLANHYWKPKGLLKEFFLLNQFTQRTSKEKAEQITNL
jgi:hypothetical protein